MSEPSTKPPKLPNITPYATIAQAINQKQKAIDVVDKKRGFFGRLFRSNPAAQQAARAAQAARAQAAAQQAAQDQAQGAAQQGQCDPNNGDGFLDKLIQVLREFVEKLKGLFSAQTSQADESTYPAAKIYILMALSAVMLAGSVVFAFVLYGKYTVRSVQSLAESGDDVKATLPYYKDVEYQAVISTNIGYSSDYPVLIIVALSALALILGAGSLVGVLQLQNQDLKSKLKPWSIRLLAYSAYAFFASAVTVGIYHVKLSPFMKGIEEFNKYIKEHMCFIGNTDVLYNLQLPENDVNLRSEIGKLTDVESFTKALFLANLYRYYGDAYKDGVTLENALSYFGGLNAILPTGSGFSNYINRKGAYVQNTADNILKNMQSELQDNAAFQSFLAINKRKIISDMEEKVNTLNSKGSCLGSVVALMYFKSMMTLLFVLLLLLPTMMYIDYRVSKAC